MILTRKFLLYGLLLIVLKFTILSEAKNWESKKNKDADHQVRNEHNQMMGPLIASVKNLVKETQKLSENVLEHLEEDKKHSASPYTDGTRSYPPFTRNMPSGGPFSGPPNGSRYGAPWNGNDPSINPYYNTPFTGPPTNLPPDNPWNNPPNNHPVSNFGDNPSTNPRYSGPRNNPYADPSSSHSASSYDSLQKKSTTGPYDRRNSLTTPASISSNSDSSNRPWDSFTGGDSYGNRQSDLPNDPSINWKNNGTSGSLGRSPNSSFDDLKNEILPRDTYGGISGSSGGTDPIMEQRVRDLENKMAKKFMKGGSFSDVSEDEVDKFHHSREKIFFEDAENASETQSDKDAPFSNEREILPIQYSSVESEDDVQENDEYHYLDSDIKAWGRKKKVFYSSDKNAEHEELLECIRIQKLKRATLRLSDYYFPGLSDPMSHYQGIQYLKTKTPFPYYKNGKLIEHDKDLYYVSDIKEISDSSSPGEQQTTESEDENLTNSAFEECRSETLEQDLDYGQQDELSGQTNIKHVDSDEGYYERIKSSKIAKKSGAPSQHFLYDRYNDIEAGSKRSISYEIFKNKGLLPTRTKEQRNPRVKQRKRYERAMKRIKGFKPIVSSQMHGAPYAGERTGIRTNVIKSTKFNH